MAEKKKPAEKVEEKAPRWESEDWVMEHPDPKKVQCKNCTWRAEDRKFPSGTVIKGCTLGMCQVMQFKPDSILYNREKCPYYLKETAENKG